jgi:Flp pilus assembly protein TadG
MQKTRLTIRRRKGERGQTIVLVAVSLVTLLAMAALAVDVVTLYVARSEMQRAADAAALAAAKAFVDSGVTSDPTNATRQTLAQTMATTVINSILPQNKVSGATPLLVAGSPAFDFTKLGNPQVTVTLQRTDLPTFFSRIWSSNLATVTASAVAEAYNPSNSPAGYSPIAPKCVKPLLVANQDPKSGAAPSKLVDPTSGAPVAANVIGERVFITPCPAGACAPIAGQFLQFRPALVAPGAANLCPGACTPPASDYETSIDCCDSANPPATQYVCGNPVAITPVNAALLNPQLSNDTNNGLQCVTNHPAEDTLDPTTLPDMPDFTLGTEPPKIIAGSGPLSGNAVTTSRSITTFPIVENADVNPVRVIGFLEVFVDPVTPAIPTNTQAHILNVIGCGNSPGAGPAVLGGGYSPIPVRLIHQ